MSNSHMFTLIENGDVYEPKPVGLRSIFAANGRIAKVGQISAEKLTALGVDCQVIDATGCYVIPGLIDPHQHIIGAGGDEGFASRTPEVQLNEVLNAGVTTVVGLL